MKSMITVSKIGVYMCVDDPLNIYKNAFTTQILLILN